MAIDVLEKWFAASGWSPFAFQRQTWRAYLAGKSGLVHAPTGMGKTYAVWLGPLAESIQECQFAGCAGDTKGGQPSRGMRIVWITPLRALANDTAESLRAAVDGLSLPWTVDLRTGDTPASARRRQQKNPPTALITTPESLSVLMSYPGCSEQFRGLRGVIIDEWHELLASKRGVQTELCLAHLRRVAPGLRTWGLSATLGNLDQAMRVLLGSQSAAGQLICGESPKVTLVDTLLPESVDRFPWSGHLGLKLLPQVIDAIESARTTLLFTNVRSQAEIWFQAILRARPDLIGQVALHHGSLDREIRTRVEEMLRAGEVRCVVCTSSLDLGVDFTPVDQVLQIGSPKGIARMMQRAGRSGHQPGAVSRILGVPTNALELVEYAAAREAAGAYASSEWRAARTAQPEAACLPPPQRPSVEAREPLDRPLDVLVQHMVTLAAGDGFCEAELADEVRSTHAFGSLGDDEWRWCMDFVVRGGNSLNAYPSYRKVVDREGRYITEDKAIERMHRMAIGTITSDAAVRVAYLNGSSLGTIEESFISRLAPGDRFVFCGKVLELIRLRNLVAHVRPARRTSGIVPRWGGGRSPLSTLLSGAIRRKLDEAREGVFSSVEMEMVRPLLELQSRWSIIPRPAELLIERTESRDGHHWFVFPFEGRLVHEGLSALVAHRITRLQPCSMLVTANDYGFELLSAGRLELTEAQWRDVLSARSLVEDLLSCLNTTSLARRQFREIARVAGLVFPGFPGQGKTARQLQASSEMFFEVFTEFDPDNLLLDQARREVLNRELEITRLREALERIQSGVLSLVSTARLTPLSFPIWAERIRTQHVTSEKWSDRVQRMIVRLEADAAGEGGSASAATGPAAAPTWDPLESTCRHASLSIL